MKKLFTLCFIFLLLNAKSYSQTQFPFYGFELNNYEVGDTLEYSYNKTTSDINDTIACMGNELYVILKKEMLGSNDSIKYTLQNILTGNCGEKRDTIQSIINNDSVYNHSNNLFHFLFFKLDSPVISSFNDSVYLKYDTIMGGLKHLKAGTWIPGIVSYEYEAIENIGIISFHSYWVVSPYHDSSINLEYAHLTHYGIYGIYQPIILATKNLTYQSVSVSIRYNNGNSSLYISSSQNLPSLKLTIYDLVGRQVITMQVNTGSNLINFNNYPKGMYLYKVTSNGNIVGQGKVMNL